MEFEPLIRVHEISSLGRVHRFVCTKFDGRQFNLFSDAELAAFLYYWWQPDTVEIYDQVKCKRDATIDIAKRLGIRHPEVTRGCPSILSTDLLAVSDVGGRYTERAVSVKRYGSPLRDMDRINLLLQKTYHEECGREWRFSENIGLNSNWASNLRWLFPYADRADRDEFTVGEIAAEDAVLTELLGGGHRTAFEACHQASRRFNLRPGAAAGAFRMLLASRVIVTDINAPSLLRLPPLAFHCCRRADTLNFVSPMG